ncbi:MAG: hypothetical protein ACRD7E_05195, partial [Bryobacteraceae bacterium]
PSSGPLMPTFLRFASDAVSRVKTKAEPDSRSWSSGVIFGLAASPAGENPTPKKPYGLPVAFLHAYI